MEPGARTGSGAGTARPPCVRRRVTSPAPTPPKQTRDDHRVQAPGPEPDLDLRQSRAGRGPGPRRPQPPECSGHVGTPQRIAGRDPDVDPHRVVRHAPAPLPRPTGAARRRSRRPGGAGVDDRRAAGWSRAPPRVGSADRGPPVRRPGSRSDRRPRRVQIGRRLGPLLDPHVAGTPSVLHRPARPVPAIRRTASRPPAAGPGRPHGGRGAVRAAQAVGCGRRPRRRRGSRPSPRWCCRTGRGAGPGGGAPPGWSAGPCRPRGAAGPPCGCCRGGRRPRRSPRCADRPCSGG